MPRAALQLTGQSLTGVENSGVRGKIVENEWSSMTLIGAELYVTKGLFFYNFFFDRRRERPSLTQKKKTLKGSGPTRHLLIFFFFFSIKSAFFLGSVLVLLREIKLTG